MRAQLYGYDAPGDRSTTTIVHEIAPRNLDCDTIVASEYVTTPILRIDSHELAVSNNKFIFSRPVQTQSIETEELHVGGELFDPSEFLTQADKHDLISETVDTVQIDGKLQVDQAIFEFSEDGNRLEIDKKIQVPNIIIGEQKFTDHISLGNSTTFKKDVYIQAPKQLSIHGKTLDVDGQTGRLRVSTVIQASGLAVRNSLNDSAYFGDVVVVGGGLGGQYDSETGPVSVTIGTSDSNDFKLCVRGRIICDGLDNSGFSSFTLFHHAELEQGSPTGLTGRLFRWSGIPRLIHPSTGAEINDWKTLHLAHSLSSVELATEHNSKRIAGILHDVCAEKEDITFSIHAPHGQTTHKYHGERELLRIASSGDHLAWVCQGGHELSHTMLSGLWTKYSNGVDEGQVLINVNQDRSFLVVDDEGLHNRLRALEQKLSALLNL